MVVVKAVDSLDLARLPAHIAIIMDGNGRWAEQFQKPRTEGHRQGSDAVRKTVRACRKLGVSALTLYAFSEQNWERPKSEVETLMELLEEYLVSERGEILDNGIRLRAVGRVDRLPEFVREPLCWLQEASKDHQGMVLSLALSYGGREEIVDAARTLATRVQAGLTSPEQITEESFNEELSSMDVGPVDLMIRTGGEQRISNFLLWGAAYAELYFTDKLWPEFEESDLIEAIGAFQKRDRRFGRVKSDETLPTNARTSFAVTT